MHRKAQAWSLDIVLAVIIFGFIAVTITSFALLNEPDVDSLEREAQLIDARLDNTVAGCSQIIQNGVINATAAECLYNKEYGEVKDDFRVRGDFCIFLEDEDGYLIQVNNTTGVGSPELRINDLECAT